MAMIKLDLEEGEHEMIREQKIIRAQCIITLITFQANPHVV